MCGSLWFHAVTLQSMLLKSDASCFWGPYSPIESILPQFGASGRRGMPRWICANTLSVHLTALPRYLAIEGMHSDEKQLKISDVVLLWSPVGLNIFLHFYYIQFLYKPYITTKA